MLLDPGSFTEFDRAGQAPGARLRHRGHPAVRDGVVTGYGTVDGRPVCVFSQDFTVFRRVARRGLRREDRQDHGSRAEDRLPDHRDQRRRRRPHPGGRGSRSACSPRIFYRNVMASGVVPQISLIMGPCAGGAVYSPAITDFTLMVEGTSHMFITGPDVIKTVTGEDVTFEELGGAQAHGVKSGVAHYQAEGEQDCIDFARELLSTCPPTNLDEPPRLEAPTPGTPASRMRPTVSSTRSSRTRRTSRTTCTRSSPTCSTTASSSRCTPGSRRTSWSASGRWRRVRRRGGQPADAPGRCLDIDASEKAARFVRTCDAFSIPILTFVDVPASCPA